MLDYTVPTNASPHKSHGGIRLSMILPASSSPSAARMLSQPSTPVHEHSAGNDTMSAGKCIIVHHFQPKTALVSVSELVAINFTYTDDVTSDASLVQLRLNVAGEYIPASVRSGPNNTLNMHAVVPSKTLSQSGQSLQLSVHAFRNGHLFDACDFGELIVEGQDDVSRPSTPTRPPRTVGNKRARDDDESSIDNSDDEFVPAAPSTKFRKLDTTIEVAKAKKKKASNLLASDAVELSFVNDLDSVANPVSWSQYEIDQGRRLVRFSREQSAHELRLSCSITSRRESEEKPGSMVISCLLPPDKNQCYLTSADFIRLISLLVDPRIAKLSIEAKNRFRRGLEVYHPITVRKKDKGDAQLFNYLMCIPAPRPITIMKDIKLFPWDVLKSGLLKILGKYAYDRSDHTLFEHGLPRSLSPRKALRPDMEYEVDRAEETIAPSSRGPLHRADGTDYEAPTPGPSHNEASTFSLPSIRQLLPEVFVHAPAVPQPSYPSIASSYFPTSPPASRSPSPALSSRSGSMFSRHLASELSTAASTPPDEFTEKKLSDSSMEELRCASQIFDEVEAGSADVEQDDRRASSMGSSGSMMSISSSDSGIGEGLGMNSPRRRSQTRSCSRGPSYTFVAIEKLPRQRTTSYFTEVRSLDSPTPRIQLPPLHPTESLMVPGAGGSTRRFSGPLDTYQSPRFPSASPGPSLEGRAPPSSPVGDLFAESDDVEPLFAPQPQPAMTAIPDFDQLLTLFKDEDTMAIHGWEGQSERGRSCSAGQLEPGEIIEESDSRDWTSRVASGSSGIYRHPETLSLEDASFAF